MKINFDRINRRKKRISSRYSGTETMPRIHVFRSNKYIYAQAIDDQERKTVASYSSLQLTKEQTTKKKSEQAKLVGAKLAELLMTKKVNSGIFDRGRYAYNGRVKALAEGLREKGLKI